jgi:enterochelin esterase family protein
MTMALGKAATTNPAKATTCLRIAVIACAFAISPVTTSAQLPPDPNYVRHQIFPSYQAFTDELNAIAATTDPAQRLARLDTLWNNLRTAGQVPYAQGDNFTFLYRGAASNVAFPGDHNNWQPSSAPAVRLAGTDLWYREGTLPDDARVDYKIVLNGGNWILDPVNPLQMWSGFGPNSELRMPDYLYPLETIRSPNAARGTLTANTRVTSANLGYQVQYRVYTPAGYVGDQLDNLPVIYVTDGHEYLPDHMGSLTAVLDNLINDRTLRPSIAVFIDPRDPNNLNNNRRIDEYNMNPQFARFVADELVPAIDAAYRTSPNADDRVILGTSLGGLNSAYFGATQSDVFRKIAIQSPAFWFNSSIYGLYDQAPQAPLQIFMTAGTINDGNGGPTMEEILDRNDYNYAYVEANEGHSWGNWRGQLGNLLVSLIGSPPHSTGDYTRDGIVDAADYVYWRKFLGQQVILGAGADGNRNGLVDPDDYTVWQYHFGDSHPIDQEAAMPVPEPVCGYMLSTGMLLLIAARKP